MRGDLIRKLLTEVVMVYTFTPLTCESLEAVEFKDVCF